MGTPAGTSDASSSYSLVSANDQRLLVDSNDNAYDDEPEAIHWFVLMAVSVLFVVILVFLLFGVIRNTIGDSETTGTDRNDRAGDGGSSGRSSPMHVILRIGSSNEKTPSLLPSTLMQKETTPILSTSTDESKSSATQTIPATTPAVTTIPTVSSDATTYLEASSKPTLPTSSEAMSEPPTTTTSTLTTQTPLPPQSLLCTLREGFTRSTMQFPPDGLCTIMTFYDFIKYPVVPPSPSNSEDFSYFLETARTHLNTEFGVGINYNLCMDLSGVSALVDNPTTKVLLDTLWSYRVYHFGQVHQLIRDQGLEPEVTGTLARCLQMISALMDEKKHNVYRPSYTILHFPLLQTSWSRIVAQQLRIYPVDIFVAVAHHPEPDNNYTDCHMVPPTITSRRLLQHVAGDAYPVRLGNTIWSLADDSNEWPPNTALAVSLGMAGRWYRPKYPDTLPNKPGNYTLGFPCATDEHSPMGQMVNVTEACIDQKYSGNFKYDVAYKSEFTYNKNERWLFTYDTARALRLKLCETKRNMTHLNYTLTAVNIQFEDAKDYCGYGEFPRLRALKVLAHFFAFKYTSAHMEQACLKAR